jgi:hypothetical protein
MLTLYGKIEKLFFLMSKVKIYACLWTCDIRAFMNNIVG